LVEQEIFNLQVGGSIPPGLTKDNQMKMIPLPGERLDVFAERLHQYVVDTKQHQRTTFNDTPIEAFPLDTVAMIVARYLEVRDQVQDLVKQLRALGVNPKLV
jgi:hypothetical protein